MASPQSRALTERHRRAQLAIRAGAVRDVTRLYPSLNLRRIAKTWPAVEDALVLAVQSHGRTSAGVGTAYYRTYRALERIPGQATPRLGTVPEAEIRRGLLYVGAVQPARQLAIGRRFAEVSAATLVNLSGEVARHTLNHGRNSIMESVRADDQAQGWIRTTAARPCSFCVMLAGRGPVYNTEEGAGFEAHQHCACSAQPVYDDTKDIPERNQEFAEAWDDATRGLSGDEARREFRRAWEGR